MTKDIIENRFRLNSSTKARLFFKSIKENAEQFDQGISASLNQSK